jgi:O-methyltransferase
MVQRNKKNISDWKGLLAERSNQVIGKKMGVVLSSTMCSQLQRTRANYVFSGDYVRYSSLELVAQEINNNGLKGNVAEVGVFRGEFARHINTAFPDRKLYLFDTFEGFNDADVRVEEKNKYTKNMDDFSNTSIDLVLNKMKYKDNVIIKQGYFPETAKGIKDTFAFVSIDTDLYEPIYNGLKFFYPRLSKGGYIFIHDYNNENYSGAKVAVRKFCKENKIPYFPLSDAAGSAVILK